MSESNGVRRYFNLGPVVRDLEHASGPGATAEGADLWRRWCDLHTEAAAETAATEMAADDDTEDEDESDDVMDDGVGDEVSERSDATHRGPGGADAGSESLHARLARLEGALATQPGQARVLQGGPLGLGRAGRRTAVLTTEAPQRVRSNRVKEGTSGTSNASKKRSRKKTSR